MKYRKLLLLLLSSSLCVGKWTKEYHNRSEVQFRFAQSQLPNLALRLEDRVLDIGCGTGRTSAFFSDHVPQGSILGIDSCQEMIEYAQETYQDKKNLQFEVADATDLQFHEQFDFVYSFFCLQWLNNTQQALDGIERALKKGGRAYLVMPVLLSDDFEIGIACLRKTIEQHPEWEAYCTIPNNDRAGAWIERANASNLRVANMQLIEKNITYASKAEYCNYCAGLGLTSLPEKEKTAFLKEAIDRMYEAYGLQVDDPYVCRIIILCLELIK